jgi:drug/metabolite transporter (DMT)-like permease
MALGASLFALMNFFARLASSSASWASVGAVRAIIGAGVALAMARLRGVPLAARDRRAMFVRSLFGTAAMVATFYALSSRTLSLGDTACLLYLTPVFLAVLAPIFLREPTGAGVVLAIALSLAGVVLVLKPSIFFGLEPRSAPRPDTLLGLFVPSGPSASATAAIAVLAAFFASIAMMQLRKMGATEAPETIALHFSVFAAVTMTALMLFDVRLPSARDAVFMAIAGVCAGFAQIAMTRAYALDAAARVGGVGYLSVVVSALLGAALLHERPDALAILGMALVVGGGLVATFARRRGA